MKNFIMKSVFIFIFVISCFLNFAQNQNFKTNELYLPKTNEKEIILCHTYYCFLYDEKYEHSKWVAYYLNKDMLLNCNIRKNEFKEDPLVTTKTANNSDYRKSGYDKGHLLPAADMVFDSTALAETFYFSNISPQVPEFNRGIWKKLETEVRGYALKLNQLFIITGPIIIDDNLKRIGKNNVAVPQFFFKSILYISDSTVQTIGFIFPNEKAKIKSIYTYSVTIDKIETETGLDLFYNLPDDIENKVESFCDTIFWKNLKFK